MNLYLYLSCTIVIIFILMSISPRTHKYANLNYMYLSRKPVSTEFCYTHKMCRGLCKRKYWSWNFCSRKHHRVFKSVHHHTFNWINKQDAETSQTYYLLLKIQLNMFRASSRPPAETTTTAVAASGLPLERGDSSAVGRGRAGRPEHDQQHCYHQGPTVNQRLLLQL